MSSTITNINTSGKTASGIVGLLPASIRNLGLRKGGFLLLLLVPIVLLIRRRLTRNLNLLLSPSAFFSNLLFTPLFGWLKERNLIRYQETNQHRKVGQHISSLSLVKELDRYADEHVLNVKVNPVIVPSLDSKKDITTITKNAAGVDPADSLPRGNGRRPLVPDWMPLETSQRSLIRGPLLYGTGGIQHAHSYFFEKDEGADDVNLISVKKDLKGLEEGKVEGEGEGGILVFICHLGSKVCGHKDTIHGGMIAALFDDVFGELFYSDAHQKYLGHTAYLKVDYRTKMPSGQGIAFSARVVRREGRKVFVKGEVRDAEDLPSIPGVGGGEVPPVGVGKFGGFVGMGRTLYAEGEALFIIPREDYHPLIQVPTISSGKAVGTGGADLKVR